MNNDFVAQASIFINAPVAKVWDALTNPETIKKYMFGAQVTSKWKAGSDIKWKGEWDGKAYEDKGKILEAQVRKVLKYSHFSSLSGMEDVPENYHTVTVTLIPERAGVKVVLTQDNNATEEARNLSQKNWETMLQGMKKVVEK